MRQHNDNNNPTTVLVFFIVDYFVQDFYEVASQNKQLVVQMFGSGEFTRFEIRGRTNLIEFVRKKWNKKLKTAEPQ